MTTKKFDNCSGGDNRRLSFHTLLYIIASLLPCISMSGQTDTIAGRVHNIGTEAVVSAVRVPTSVSSSRPTWQIDREAMEQLGLQNLADAVKRMAGASV
ncbi:MAG: hypothetical protein II750_01525, partial [Bacteroidaceae bacterium]|nr:hypothetical protein [Bacteroidaceae bacterium]